MEATQEQITAEDVRRMMQEFTAEKDSEKDEKTTKEPETFSVRLPGGTVLEAASQKELQNKLDEIDRQYAVQREVERIKAEAAESNRQEQAKVRTTEAGDDSKKRLEALAKKFEEGDGYGFEQELVDGFFRRKFGYGVEEFVQRTHQAISMSAEVAQVTAAKAFVDRHPEFVQNDENSRAMQAIIQARNYQTDVEGLEDAYRFGVARGLIKTQTQEAREEEAPRRVKAPPRAGKSSSKDLYDEGDDLDAFDNMSLEQQEAFLRRLERGGTRR